MGLKFQPCSPDPRAAPKNLAEHVATQAAFLDAELKPRLDAARAGSGHVFFVDAAHFVFGTFLCCLWSFRGSSSVPRRVVSGSMSWVRGMQ